MEISETFEKMSIQLSKHQVLMARNTNRFFSNALTCPTNSPLFEEYGHDPLCNLNKDFDFFFASVYFIIIIFKSTVSRNSLLNNLQYKIILLL